MYILSSLFVLMWYTEDVKLCYYCFSNFIEYVSGESLLTHSLLRYTAS